MSAQLRNYLRRRYAATFVVQVNQPSKHNLTAQGQAQDLHAEDKVEFIISALKSSIFNLVFSLAPLLPSSYVASMQTKVTQLPQTHNDPVFGLRNFAAYHRASFFQFEIAQYLLRHPDSEVIVEGFDTDYDESNRAVLDDIFRSNGISIESQFPSGFPKTLDDLDPMQRMTLVRATAAGVLFVLKKIPKLRADTTGVARERMAKKSDEMIERLKKATKSDKEDRGLDEFIFEIREKVVVEKVAEIRKENNFSQKPIIIVFGSRHDYSKYFQGAEYQFERERGIEMAASLEALQTDNERYKKDMELYKSVYENPMKLDPLGL